MFTFRHQLTLPQYARLFPPAHVGFETAMGMQLPLAPSPPTVIAGKTYQSSWRESSPTIGMLIEAPWEPLHAETRSTGTPPRLYRRDIAEDLVETALRWRRLLEGFGFFGSAISADPAEGEEAQTIKTDQRRLYEAISRIEGATQAFRISFGDAPARTIASAPDDVVAASQGVRASFVYFLGFIEARANASELGISFFLRALNEPLARQLLTLQPAAGVEIKGDPKVAQREFEAALHLLNGALRSRRRDHSAASSQLAAQEAVLRALDPSQFASAVTVLLSLAAYHRAEGFFLKAIASYKYAIRLSPERADLYETLGDLYEHLALSQDAISTYQRAIALYTKVGNTGKVRALEERVRELQL